MATHSCQICATGALLLLPEYAELPRATSDSRPWPAGGTLAVCRRCGAIQKIPDAVWRDEARHIYSNYEIYHQSDGSEQLLFNAQGTAEPRSMRLLSYVKRAARLGEAGRYLDIGCGNGAALRSFSKTLPGWELYGCEISTATLGELERIPNFKRLFTVAPREIGEKFSLVSMIHTLEHMQEPQEALLGAAELIDRDGCLFIEVPDIENSPFDLLVADHLLHFSRATLGLLAARCGLLGTTLRNDFVAKEITLLAHQGAPAFALPDPEIGLATVRRALTWLAQTVETFRASARGGPLAIFGTAVAGMALYGAFRDQVEFFVDEDPHRIGRQYDSKPVLPLGSAKKDIPILLALPPHQAQPLSERCAEAGLHYVLPPPLPSPIAATG